MEDNISKLGRSDYRGAMEHNSMTITELNLVSREFAQRIQMRVILVSLALTLQTRNIQKFELLSKIVDNRGRLKFLVLGVKTEGIESARVRFN